MPIAFSGHSLPSRFGAEVPDSGFCLLKNPRDTADGCSATPLLPLNSYYTNRTHKYSIYKILLQDLYFWRELFEVHRELTIHYNNANVTNLFAYFL